ncbi:MAG: efflux RND transporter periplasmic adaptor subunit [Phaeodactylibacter sp.]|nr:efflux RND transporter periplasmic adaptor subunit [Phaeodactylibacter sp.]
MKTKDFKHYVDIQGSVQSDDLIAVSSETGGRIIELKVVEGQAVNKGQLIARLDLEQLKKQIAEVETSLTLAEEVYERQKRLWEQNIGSEIQFLQAQNSKERLEKTLETLQYQLSKSEVYAPISGVVERLISKAGEVTGPGAPIIQILNTNKVKVVADVPENYLTAVRNGQTVTVHFPALDKEVTAPITMVGRTINPGNRTFKIEINMNNPGGLLKPNLLANVQLNDYTSKDAITVPLELVQQEVGGQNYVFVKGDSPDGPIAQKVYVEPGESFEGEIVIKSGLTGDEILILKGARSLTDQALIEIQKG